MSDRATVLRQEIMLCVKANNLPVSGDFWLMLAYRTEAELVQIARELNVKIPS